MKPHIYFKGGYWIVKQDGFVGVGDKSLAMAWLVFTDLKHEHYEALQWLR